MSFESLSTLGFYISFFGPHAFACVFARCGSQISVGIRPHEQRDEVTNSSAAANIVMRPGNSNTEGSFRDVYVESRVVWCLLDEKPLLVVVCIPHADPISPISRVLRDSRATYEGCEQHG